MAAAPAAPSLPVGRRRRRLGAVLRRWHRPRLSLASALALSFGLMLVTALGSVLALSYSVGAANTRTLLADRTSLLLDMLSERATGFLRPVEAQLGQLAEALADGELDAADTRAGRRALQAVFATTPQLSGLAVVQADLTGWRFEPGTRPGLRQDWSRVGPIREAVAQAEAQQGVAWGPPMWSPTLRRTVINARMPVRRDGRLVSILLAAVTLDRFVEHVTRLSATIGQPVFVLQGRDRIVALPRLDMTTLGPDRPLPLLAEAGDPVLAAMWVGAEQPLALFGERLRGEAHRVEVRGRSYVVFYREIRGFGDQPWIVGTYVPMQVAAIEVQRLWRALALSAIGLLLAVAATFWLGYRMAQPVERLAAAARRVQTLELATPPPLPRSTIRELDDAAEAFNAMSGALTWFETYLPRRLVRQLMRNPSPDAVPSRKREGTVLFTDLVGFSSLAEQLDAAEAAALLNRHFELLAGGIAATDGTLDKYLGDGVMAFWGAPVPQPDHAARAVQAAIRIRERLRAAAAPPHLRLRIGIHSGPALVGNIGSRDRLNYTLIGDTVNVAHRLEQLGKEVAPMADVVILLGPTTARQVEDWCPLESLGARRLRGRDETIEVFRLP